MDICFLHSIAAKSTQETIANKNFKKYVTSCNRSPYKAYLQSAASQWRGVIPGESDNFAVCPEAIAANEVTADVSLENIEQAKDMINFAVNGKNTSVYQNRTNAVTSISTR